MTRFPERPPGRRPGQGWYLEDETRHWLLSLDWMASTRVVFWGAEVDVVALRDGNGFPRRLVCSCKDWFCRHEITPCTLWRLIALAMTARAEPVLVYNHRAELTAPAQRIAERWRVRLVTDEDIRKDATLPDPERPPRGINWQYPPPINMDADVPHYWAPDYYGALDTETARERLDIHR